MTHFPPFPIERYRRNEDVLPVRHGGDVDVFGAMHLKRGAASSIMISMITPVCVRGVFKKYRTFIFRV